MSLDLFTSCHKCINNKIPTLFIFNDSEYEIMPFDIEQDPPYEVDDPLDNLMACLNKDLDGFYLEEDYEFDSIPANCGLAVYEIDKGKWGEIDDLPSIICGACSPGYKPTFQDDIITVCEEIQSCDLDSTNNVFYNKCGECLLGFVWDWDSTYDTIDY